jgi:hypothetical protein
MAGGQEGRGLREQIERRSCKKADVASRAVDEGGGRGGEGSVSKKLQTNMKNDKGGESEKVARYKRG